MRAAIFDEFGGAADVRSTADPVPSPGGVVVQVHATGLCRSDWHAWAGHDAGVALPHVPGHELVGVVVAVGVDVARWTVGARVTTPFVCGCGRCRWCDDGQAQVCPDQTQPGFTHWGSFAEYVALHAADTNLVAVAAGARVVAVDRTPAALDLARSLGAEHTVLADDGRSLTAEVHELTGGGSHVAVDAVGSVDTCAVAIHSLRRRGRHVQVGLLPGGHAAVPMDRVIAWELDVLGSHGMAAVDYPGMLRLVEDGTLQPQALVERTVGLVEGARLLPSLDTASPVGVTLIDPRS